MAQDETAFRRWYQEQSKRYGLNPDPDDASQLYDYRAAFKANAKPDASGHWPSDFKRPGHPNEVVGGFNTRTGERVKGTPRSDYAGLVASGWDKDTAKRLSQMPEPQDRIFTLWNGKEVVVPSDWSDEETSAALDGIEAEERAKLKPLSSLTAPYEQKKAGMTTPGGITMMDAGAGMGFPDRASARKTLPVAAGATAAALTGGLSVLPQIVATGLAGAGASAAGDVANDEPVDIGRAVGEGALQAAPAGLGVLKFLKKPLQSAGVKGWQYAAGTGSQKAAREILEEGAGTLRQGNLTRMASPRSPTGAFVPRRVSPQALEAMRSGVERAGQSSPVTMMDALSAGGAGYLLGPKAGVALGAAKMAAKPLPASYLSQKVFNTGQRTANVAKSGPGLTRAALISMLLGNGSAQ